MNASEGAKKAGAEVELFQFQETLSSEVLTKMHTYKAATDPLPVIKPDDLTRFDGFILAFPTRYGRAPAQVSTFFDSTGGLWAKGALVGKFGGVITSTGGQHGGMETTVLTTIPYVLGLRCRERISKADQSFPRQLLCAPWHQRECGL
jgi:NAD(P)H dehydrogenase (quinone)